MKSTKVSGTYLADGSFQLRAAIGQNGDLAEDEWSTITNVLRLRVLDTREQTGFDYEFPISF